VVWSSAAPASAPAEKVTPVEREPEE
jgi:hypothetical protein